MENETFLGDCIAEYRSHYEDDPTKIPVFREQIQLWQHQAELSKAHLLDSLALRLARDFHQDKLDFDFCSTFLRNLQRASSGEWPELFWDTYIAFDAGEFSHPGQSGDPVETHTRPMVKEILDRQQ